MEIGKLNVYYVTSELNIGNTTTPITSAYFSNATEEEFGIYWTASIVIMSQTPVSQVSYNL
jgi:hypothetical protein